MKVSILWQGKPISSMKTFRKLNCNLCMNERLQILNASRADKLLKTKKLINSSTEIYGVCRHKPKFHRYALSQRSRTDEGRTSPERGTGYRSEDSPTSPLGGQEHTYARCVPCEPLVEDTNRYTVVDL